MELWLDEILEIPNGRALKIRVKEHLYTENTEFQKIDVFETQAFGRIFTLDGVVMMTEADEFAYHEMIAHVPMISHPNPKKVLVIGGGDGGTVREALKHPGVEEVHLCEIDKRVVDVSYEYFPDVASAMKDPKVKHVYSDGAEYIRQNPNSFDVILVDSSDPIGPAEVLFRKPFYESMYAGLKEGGIISTQSESFYYHGETIRGLFNFIPEVFDHCGYYFTVVPTYPSGIIGFSIASKGLNFHDIPVDASRVPKGLKYYNKDIHKAAFALPEFAKSYIVTK